ncbi:hypothetical protein FQN54_005118 [Arachnomyces sp. PD_36]|nr:hypothetical protein FQN54_005118 [Arachnomyces sp. PD_36]
MSPARAGVEEGSEQQPSHRSIEHGNPAIFKPTWRVLDDINIDLFTACTILAACVAALFTHFRAALAFGAAAVVIVPLRLAFPRPKPPQGLVLITGASSGIGAELSYIFAEKDHNLVLVGRNEEQLEAVKTNVKDKYGKTAYTITCDLSLPGSAQKLYDQVIKQGLHVNVLVNNAGLGSAGDPFEQPTDLAERMTTLNCTSLVQLTQLFGRDMIKQGSGWLLHVSSVGGKFNSSRLPFASICSHPTTTGWMASPGQNLYHATKHYVRAFSEALNMELRAYPGIVNTQLMPGPTHTQFVTRAHAEETVMMGAAGSLEDAKAVAMAGYNGLCKRKRMVFGSWGDAFMATVMQVVPRSVHLTLASGMNAPTRGMGRMKEPEKDQNVRGADLEEKK